MFRIASFAQIAGVSAKMLRAWDALGLFRPAWTDRGSGYRYYSPAQLPELRRILALRDLGVPLAEVTTLVAGGDDLRATLDRRRHELERERREVDRRLRALEISVATADSGSNAPDVVVQRLSRLLVATRSVLPHEDDSAAFYEVEALVRDLGLRADRPPMTLVHPPASGSRLPEEVAIPIKATFEPRGRVAARELPASRAATLIHRGPYAGLVGVQRSLQSWVRSAGLTTSGRLRVVYLQFGAEPELRVPPAYIVERTADFVTELQLELD
jgi:DNA-binding transcriptional MerR regulator